MKSFTAIARTLVAGLPVVLLGAMGAKAFVNSSTSTVSLPVVSQVAVKDAAASVAPVSQIETGVASDSSSTVSMALPVILPVRSPVRP